MRNVLARVSTGQAEMIAAATRTSFAQPTADTVRGAVENVALTLARQFPTGVLMLSEAREEITASPTSRRPTRCMPPTSRPTP